MQWNLDKKRPICPQICEQLCVWIANGELPPGSRLLSVREVAVMAGVNPNTVQKSFEELEQTGLIYSVRGSGWFVGENTQKAKDTAAEMMRKKTGEYFAAMKNFGLSAEDTKKYIKEWKL